ncbi:MULTISPECIES: sensor histidine kinase [unclassified Paenibacillus]|uniref:cache domain-containing sensor histidine kinase n=1 Tax=unclassified Paenibacillus TaxID=185978 RepID=UPI002405B856|nr:MULTISPECIES: sensor histidine kinase [unclassified Paenibacillus]
MNPKNYRLRSKLIITYILLTVVPISLLGYISYSQYTRSVEAQVGEYVPKILDQANENIDKQMEELTYAPELLYNSSEVISILRKNDYPTRSEFLNDRFIMNSYLSSTYFTEKNTLLGVFVWTTKQRLFSSTTVSYTGFDKEPDWLGQDTIILQDETDLRFKGKPPFFLIVKPILDVENRRNIGTIMTAVKLSFMEKVLLDIKGQDRAELWIMNKKGKVIYHTDPKQIGTVEDMTQFPLTNGSFRAYKNGERMLVSVSESERMDWITVHSIPFKYLTEQADVIRDYVIWIFVAFVLASIILSVYMALTVSRPIYKLSRLMRTIEKGDFQVDLNIDSRDEMGILARSFNSMVARIKELLQLNYHIEIRQKQAELYALQSQINPHFMYNTLETISMAVEEDEKETVVEMVTLLGRMLRFSLSNKDRIVAMNKEVEHINNYLSIQKYRFEQRLHFTIESDIELQQYYSPKFILQPIIENSIKYGLETRKMLSINIRINKIKGIRPNTEDIAISVKDSGTGIDDATLQKIHHLLRSDPIVKRDSGFGLINVHARIMMLFGPGYGLTVERALKEGTEVVIRIPIINDLLTVEKYERIEDESYRG